MANQFLCTKKNRFISSTADELQQGNHDLMRGYEHLPLVSLEEAVESIVPFLPDIMNKVYEAKEKCRQNTELTMNESAAIYLYTMTSRSLYENLNKTLRTENPQALQPWSAFLKLFFTAVGKLPSCSTTVWRGVYGINGSDFVKDHEFTWWSIISCSSYPSVANAFASEKGTLFCIKAIHGKNITKYSTNQNEEEILLMPGTRLRIKGKSISRGFPIVHLQECGMMLGGQHVMLSYHGNNQDLVSKVGLGLKDENIPIWFEERKDMMHDLHQSLCEGVENAAIICCFISSDYEQCDKCKLELLYARKQCKAIIPCLLNDPKTWKPFDWLESITKELECIVFEDIPDLDIDSKIIELIYRIKYQPRLPQSLGSSLLKKPGYLFELIRYEYQQNSRVERLINPAKSYPIEQSYINLAIVTAKEQQAKEKQLHNTQYGDAIMGTYEEIYGMKTTVDIENIFKTCKNQQKQVLVLGRAGIGKSTFCRYAAYQWAMGAYWSEYELLALIPLRRLTADRYPPLSSKQNYSLIDIVKKEIFYSHLSEKDESLLEKQFNTTKTLWILDGYDEMVQDTSAHLEHLFEKLLKTPHHILTSRPYNIALLYDVQMEITGFTDENIEKFVQQFFDQLKDEPDDSSIKGQNLLNFLQSNPSIWGVAHIPVNLELICSFWSNEEWSETTEIKITTIYAKITEWLCRRYLKASNKQIEQLSKNDIDQLCQEELTFLEILAFNAMRDNIIIMRPVSLQTALTEAKLNLQKHSHILNIGVLKAFTKQGIGDQIQLNKDHYFVHLSFQEYFAARYLINALNGSSSQQAIEFININKYNQRFTLLFTFAAGILTEATLEQALNVFWDTLSSEPLDLIGIRHIQLIMSCLGETSKTLTFHRRSELMICIIRWTLFVVFTKYKNIQSHIMASFKRSPSLTCDQSFIHLLINLLQHDHLEIKRNVCHLIADLPTSSAQSKLLQPLFKLLRDDDVKVRKYACFALSTIGEKAGISEVISKLVTALDDESWSVRDSVVIYLAMIGSRSETSEVIDKLVTAVECDNENVRSGAFAALGCIGEKAGTSEVISKLVTALEDKSENVRWRAYVALGKIGEKAATNEVISKLVTALEDHNENVRIGACSALGNIGVKAATSEVISKLVTALEDESAHVRSDACFALGKIGEKAATSEVIIKLVTVLEDENENVRSVACEALGMIGEKAGTSEVITKLVTVLEGDDENGKRDACQALGNIRENAETGEVITKLVTALENQDENVRRGACFALGNIGEKAATSEVISKLVTALEDENENVRRGACFALGMIGEKAATSEVISKLVTALECEHGNVRSEACQALGKIGEKVATSELIRKLVTALEDENENVRKRACQVLGNIGEKAETSEVINKLVTVLEDEYDDEYVRRGAGEALGKIGEKAATNEVISTVETVFEDEDENVKRDTCDALGNIAEKAGTNEIVKKLLETVLKGDDWLVHKTISKILQTMLSYFSVVTQLQSDTVALLYGYLDNYDSDREWSFPPDHFINAFLCTKSNALLAVASLVAVLQRNAVIVTHSSIIIYGSKEPVELSINNGELLNQLAQAFIDQSMKLGLPSHHEFETTRSRSHRENVELVSEPHPNSKPKGEKCCPMCSIA